MDNLPILEEYYQSYIRDLSQCLPDGIIEVDLALLQRLDLLECYEGLQNPALTRYFHVIESHEKITLVNDQFVIWVVPGKAGQEPITYTLIALNNGYQTPQLELVFSNSGVYNSSSLVLRVLEKFLGEIQETEELLRKFVRS